MICMNTDHDYNQNLYQMNNQEEHIEVLKKIDAYLNGEMSQEERDSFWDLLIENPDYYQALKLEVNLRAVVQEQSGYSDIPDTSEPLNEPTATVHPLHGYGGWLVAIAAVLVLVIGINLLKVSSPTSPLNRIALLDDLNLIASIDLFEMESIPSTRGDATTDDPLIALFDEGLMAAFSDNPEEALQLYDDIIERYGEDPRVGKAYLNAGIILYNNSKYDRAAEYFWGAIENASDSLLAEKAWWYKANAELVTENYEMARYSMYMTYGYDGIYRREAFRQLRILDAYLGITDFEDIEPELIDP
jgi:tetratricopeptide (TPR) repeat protein